ncbi:MAG: hypothetical protein GY799_30855, partial [Desulfobulbaceae bacterium]|nr:hypothetical protein [Desulfobulbaceae bacterium]
DAGDDITIDTSGGSIRLGSTTSDIIFDLSSNAGRIEIIGATHTDSHPIFNIATSDGDADFYVGEDTPVGNVSATGGSFYFRDDELNTSIFMKRSTGAPSTTGWTEVGAGDVTGPGPTVVDNAAATFNGTGGLDIQNVDTVLITGSASEAAVTIQSPSGTGDAKIALETSGSAEAFAIRYLETSDVVQALTNKNVTFSNIAASGTFNFSHGVTGKTTFLTTGANTNPPISFEASGANGSIAELYLSTVTPQAAITSAVAGDLCIYSEEDNPKLYISGTGGATNNDWYYMPVIFEGPDQVLSIPSGSGSGSSTLKLVDSSDADQIVLQYDESLAYGYLTASTIGFDLTCAGDLLVESGNSYVRIRHDEVSTAGAVARFENQTVQVSFHLLDADPQGVQVASPGDFVLVEDGTESGLYLQEGYTGSDDDWHKVVTSPSNGMIGTVYGGLGQYQNYLEYSEDIDNAAWTKEIAVTVTPNNIVSPNGQ